jgi:uncharacterized protein (TIGR01244 family)
MQTRIVLAPLLLLPLVTGCATVGKNVTGIDNFAQVDDALYRGAQPSEDGVETLRQQGVRTIINLRDDPNPAEPAWAERAGITYIAIPSKATKVEPAKVAEFLQDVEHAPRPVFIHCRQGRDRTGLDVAVYRIVYQGWTRDAALKDLYDHGYHWAVFPGIAKYVKSFDPQAVAPAKEVKPAGG